jgi:1,4-alpha-glucan branching enzyme
MTALCYRGPGGPQPRARRTAVSAFLEQLLDRSAPELARIAAARHGNPASVLGVHRHGARTVVIVLLPGAVRARLNRRRDLSRWREGPLFAWCGRAEGLPVHCAISWEDAAGQPHDTVDPYGFKALSPPPALARFLDGTAHDAAELFGAHRERHFGVDGVRFALYAPAARSVALVLSRTRCWPMQPLGASGAWELFLPGIAAGTRYRFDVETAAGELVRKTDPFGQQFELRPRRAARVVDPKPFGWTDAEWLARRRRSAGPSAPISIYELHLGSWRRPAGRFAGYRTLAPRIAEHALALGFTHVELLPVTEHPHDASWGYQATGYFAPTSRHGGADDFRWFVDHLHGRGLGVILDWVPGHFAADAHALANFDGGPLFEYADPRRGEHRHWGTRVFDFSRPAVRSFLLSSARFWLDQFHVDGLRVDAVAAMLYLDYQRAAGQWLPNAAGGHEHEAAIEFLRALNQMIRREFPGVLSCAEESTAWPGVTVAVAAGGLGFDLKWNLGFMHDTLAYFGEDPLFRRHHHERLTGSLGYAFAERYLLPFSHDEVVHEKRSLLGRMPGDRWQRFANLRLLYAWQWSYPGKKLLFMGGEFAQPTEWDHRLELPWSLGEQPEHAGILALVADLNRLYRELPALHALDHDAEGFAWIDDDDRLRSVLAFERRAGDSLAVVALNFTPVPRLDYRLGLPRGGGWRERLNTDAAYYGGSNVGNLSRVEALRDPARGRRYSASVTLPPLGAIVLTPE